MTCVTTKIFILSLNFELILDSYISVNYICNIYQWAVSKRHTQIFLVLYLVLIFTPLWSHPLVESYTILHQFDKKCSDSRWYKAKLSKKIEALKRSDQPQKTMFAALNNEHLQLAMTDGNMKAAALRLRSCCVKRPWWTIPENYGQNRYQKWHSKE